MATDPWGIDDGYEDVHHVWHDTPRQTRAAIQRAMDVGGSDCPAGDYPAVLVARQGETPRLPAGRLTLEDGTTISVGGRLPGDLPIGYHDWAVDEPGGPNAQARVIIAPGSGCTLPARRCWGWAAQLYAARSQESWGIGDLADLRRLAHWSRGLGADVLLLNPLGAASPAPPQQPSPYYPSSRRFHNPLYLRVEEVPQADRLGAALEPLAVQGRALNEHRLIDRDAVWRLKQQALEAIWQCSTPGADFERFRVQAGFALRQFAVYAALAEQYGADWRGWPEPYHCPDQSTVEQVAADQPRRVMYHQWLQWLLELQLARAAGVIGLVHDLPIGIDPGGADAWAWQAVLAHGCSIGAPPDLYNPRGQDWGLPPWVPHKLRAAGYEPLIQTLRAAMRHAAGLRIDHVMGLFRLYWIPHGFEPDRGAFVRYPVDELLAIVALESHRAGALVVGEDLGTVEDDVRSKLAANRVLSCRVLWFEENPPSTYPELALATVTTHDLPTVAGLWSGRDIQDQQRLKLEPSVEKASAIRDCLAATAHLPASAPVSEAIKGAYGLLAEAPSLLVIATLEDALAVHERPNMPGTTDQWPNWSLALPGGIEALESGRLAASIAGLLAAGDRSVKKCGPGDHCPG